jgi:ubiquinone/menaquinone biosynthesis C-methylase UbiE
MPDDYFASIGDVREKMRVERQARILDREINPLQGVDLSHVRNVLGIGCGTGSWLIQFVQKHPEAHATGLDIDKGMLSFARVKAHVAGVAVDLVEGDALQPLKFPDGAFDLIHMRMSIGFIKRDAWPALLAECLRVLRPGGLIVLTEVEDSATNDALFDRYGKFMYRAFHVAGHTFADAPEQSHMCLSIALKKLLMDAGFTCVVHMGHDIDFSYGEQAHMPVLENIATAFENAKPFFCKFGGARPEEVDAAASHAYNLIKRTDFLGFWHFISAVGYKALIILFCIQLCYNAFIGLS